MKSEGDFQADVIKKLKIIFPGSEAVKNDAKYLQGWPDFTVYYKSKYALLEFKRSEHESHRPNQDYYVNLINSVGGFARFIYPENEHEIISELILFFKGETK